MIYLNFIISWIFCDVFSRLFRDFSKELISIFFRYSYLNNRRRTYRRQVNNLYRKFDTFYRRRSTGLKVTVGCSFALMAGCCFTGSDSVLQKFQLDYVEVLLMRCFLQMLINSLWITFKNYSFWPSGTTFKAKVYMMTNVSVSWFFFRLDIFFKIFFNLTIFFQSHDFLLFFFLNFSNLIIIFSKIECLFMI